MTEEALRDLSLKTCLGFLRSWDELKRQYRDEADELCLEWERRGQRVAWDAAVNSAKAIRRRDFGGKS
jgi:hypothetical protein